jgi:hypothetical protein
MGALMFGQPLGSHSLSLEEVWSVFRDRAITSSTFNELMRNKTKNIKDHLALTDLRSAVKEMLIILYV